MFNAAQSCPKGPSHSTQKLGNLVLTPFNGKEIGEPNYRYSEDSICRFRLHFHFAFSTMVSISIRSPPGVVAIVWLFSSPHFVYGPSLSSPCIESLILLFTTLKLSFESIELSGLGEVGLVWSPKPQDLPRLLLLLLLWGSVEKILFRRD
jgi:hypothetical protein